MLDVTTLFVVAISMTGLLGLFLLFLWIQDRGVRALGWWGGAYVLGGFAVSLWAARPSGLPLLSVVLAPALLFGAAGMIWSGARVFHGRRPLWGCMMAGSTAWLAVCHWPDFQQSAGARVLFCSFIIAGYIVLSAAEMRRERRRPLQSPWMQIAIPLLHGAVFLSPMAIAGLPPGRSILASAWFGIFAIETLLYVVGTAFIVVVLAHERQVAQHKIAAITDPLTNLLNRRGFLERAQALVDRTTAKGQSVAVMMFDLDKFKLINDRFGHDGGDEALRVFGKTVTQTMRVSDIVGRLGGEEFAAIVPGGEDVAATVAERVRAAFQEAGVEIGGYCMNATVSIGMACSDKPGLRIEALLSRADAALYRAKAAGRNRAVLAPAAMETPPAIALPEGAAVLAA